MKNPALLLVRAVITPFYKQNAGLLLFLLFIQFAAVGRANEAGLLEYHYALIVALLLNPGILALVCVAWALYAARIGSSVARTLADDRFSFLAILAQTGFRTRYGLFALAQAISCLPVLFYAGIVVRIGLQRHAFAATAEIVSFQVLSVALPPLGYDYWLRHPGRTPRRFLHRPWMPDSGKWYALFFLRFILAEQKVLFLAIKAYSCGMLFAMLRPMTPGDEDLRMPILFYSFGLLGHSVLVHALRGMEETRLDFYRSLPVSLGRRFAQYAGLYLLLFVPEMTVLWLLTPANLHPVNALLLGALGFGVLLLLNSVLFIRYQKITDYLKIATGIFFGVFIGVLAGVTPLVVLFCFALAAAVFFSGYYRYDK